MNKLTYVNPVIYQRGLEGDGMISPCNRYFWVKIPKCASTSIETHLKSLNWTVSNYRRITVNNLIYFSIIRDPIERWISGMSEYLRLYQKRYNISIDTILNYLNDNFFIEMMFNGMIFDRHTQTQSYYLENINLNNMTFFKFGSTLNDDLASWFDECLLPHNWKTFPKLHSNTKKCVIINELRELINKNNNMCNRRIEEWFNYELFTFLPTIEYYRNTRGT